MGHPSPRHAGSSRAILLQVGFSRARVTAVLCELLPHNFTLTRESRAVCFCGTFLRVASTGRYPAPSPLKPGLSSPPALGCPKAVLSLTKGRPPSVLRAYSIIRVRQRTRNGRREESVAPHDHLGGIAQLVEHYAGSVRVRSSSLLASKNLGTRSILGM